MSCGCATGLEPSIDSDEFWAIWRERRLQRTRKKHRCCECGVKIPVGSRCCFGTGLGDGGWATFYRCLDCSFLVEKIATEEKVCVVWGWLRDFWDETMRDIDPTLPRFMDLVAARSAPRSGEQEVAPG